MNAFINSIMNILYIAILLIVAMWLFHRVAPEAAHYLTSGEVEALKTILGGLVAIVLVKHVIIYLNDNIEK